MGKAASAYMIQTADAVHKDEGMQFFYVDERKASGGPAMMAIDGQAHADFFLALAERSAGKVPWQATFVKDKGYVEFPHGIPS